MCGLFRSLMMFSFRCRLGVKALAYGVDAFISIVVVVELGYTPSDVLQQIGRCVVGRRDLPPNFHGATIVFVNTTQHIASMLKRSIESPSSSSLSSSFESLKTLYQLGVRVRGENGYYWVSARGAAHRSRARTVRIAKRQRHSLCLCVDCVRCEFQRIQITLHDARRRRAK